MYWNNFWEGGEETTVSFSTTGKNQLLLAMCLLTNAKGLAVGNGFSGHEYHSRKLESPFWLYPKIRDLLIQFLFLLLWSEFLIFQ